MHQNLTAPGGYSQQITDSLIKRGKGRREDFLRCSKRQLVDLSSTVWCWWESTQYDLSCFPVLRTHECDVMVFLASTLKDRALVE